MSATLRERAASLLAKAAAPTRLHGRVVVIKVGGASVADGKTRARVASDIAVLSFMGLRPIVVHGGGPDITARMKASGLPVEFVRGLRVTSPEAIRIVREVLVDKNNRELVLAINVHGDLAVGLSGDQNALIRSTIFDPALGRVGDVTGIDEAALFAVLDSGQIPVIACLGTAEDGRSLNINADIVAAEIARATRAELVLFLTDVDGLYRDFADKSSIIVEMSLAEAEALLASGTLGAGMAPKIEACVRSLRAGAKRTRIVNASREGALLSELDPDAASGTSIHRGEGN